MYTYILNILMYTYIHTYITSHSTAARAAGAAFVTSDICIYILHMNFYMYIQSMFLCMLNTCMYTYIQFVFNILLDICM